MDNRTRDRLLDALSDAVPVASAHNVLFNAARELIDGLDEIEGPGIALDTYNGEHRLVVEGLGAVFFKAGPGVVELRHASKDLGEVVRLRFNLRTQRLEGRDVDPLVAPNPGELLPRKSAELTVVEAALDLLTRDET